MAAGQFAAGKEVDASMEYLLIIPGKLHGFNDYISAERSNRYGGAQMKKADQNIVIHCARKQLRGVKIESPVYMEYTWYESNRQRDKDNICAFGRKVIQDGLVNSGVLHGDGWKHIIGFSDKFEVDRENPRIEVLIKEAAENI